MAAFRVSEEVKAESEGDVRPCGGGILNIRIEVEKAEHPFLSCIVNTGLPSGEICVILLFAAHSVAHEIISFYFWENQNRKKNEETFMPGAVPVPDTCVRGMVTGILFKIQVQEGLPFRLLSGKEDDGHQV